MSTKPYSPVGRCIYCGEDDGKLSIEHIIPFCMGGDLKLPAASCEKHRHITQKMEERCFGHFLKEYRVKAGVQSNNQPPMTLRAYFKDHNDNDLPCEEVPVLDYPEAGTIPVFSTAGIIAGRELEENYKVGIHQWINPADKEKLLALTKNGARRLRLGRVIPGLYARVLAKAALGFAIAELGLNQFDPFVRKLILSDTAQHYGHYVGGYLDEGDPGNPTSAPYEIGFLDAPITNPKLIVVLVRLLANQGWPTNYVVVGRRF